MGLSVRSKFLYGLGDFGFSLSLTFLGTNFVYFMTGPVGLPMALAGLVMFIGKTSDYLNDPLVGFLSDRTRTRWGRRRPFLLWGALPFAACFAVLWIVPPIETRLGLCLWFMGAYVLFDLAASVAYIPYFALTPELSENYDERTSLTSYRMAFSILGSLAAFGIPVRFVDSAAGRTSAGNIFLMAVIIGAVCGSVLIAAFFSCRERQDHVPQRQPKLSESLKAAAGNPVFVRAGLIFLFTWTAVEIMVVVIKYYIAFVVRREADSIWIMMAIFLTALASLPAWNALAKRLDKPRAFIAGALILAVSLGGLVALAPETPLSFILAMAVVAGLGVGAIHLLPWALLPDAVEVDEAKSGSRHEGMYYSLISLAQKVSVSIAIPLVTFMMSLTGFLEASSLQPSSAVMGIRLAMALPPAALLFVSVALAARYGHGRQRHAELVGMLEARRSAVRPRAGDGPNGA